METMQKLYDSQARQRVPMRISFGAEAYEVTFHFKPLDDESIINYIDAQLEPGESASPALFKHLIESADGCGDGDKPFTATELGELVPEVDQAFAIDSGLLGTSLLPNQKATRWLNWRRPPVSANYSLEAFFDGSTITTRHNLGLPTSEHYRVYQSLQAKSFPIKFGDLLIRSYGRGLIALYEAMVIANSGYANDRVPAHHKMVVVAAHLRGQRDLMLGK